MTTIIGEAADRLFMPSDATFDARRQGLVWQAIKPDRYPHAIWQAHSNAEIVEALAYARARGLHVSIVSGGHSYIGHGVRDGKLLLDLSLMKGRDVDADKRCGWVESGVRVAEFDAALEHAGLAFPIGHDPNVGLVGYLLGGGMGWNPESWNGMACFNVTAAEIILASGEKIVADAEHHADLFWAVRGAGPNFCGVVSRFHVQLFPRPAAIRKSDYVFSLDALEAVLAWLARMWESLGERIELSFSFTASESEGMGVSMRCVVSLIIFADSDAEASLLAAPFAQSVPEDGLIDRQETKAHTFLTLLDEAKGDASLRRAVESVWTDDPFSAARAAAHAFASAPSPETAIYFGMRKRDVLPADTACSMFGRGFVFIDAAWRVDEDDDRNRLWVDTLMMGLHPYDKGAYINENDWERRPERVMRCYSDEAFLRLRQINLRYDPEGLFPRPCDD